MSSVRNHQGRFIAISLLLLVVLIMSVIYWLEPREERSKSTEKWTISNLNRRYLAQGNYIPPIGGEYTDYSELVRNIMGTTHRESENKAMKNLQAKSKTNEDISKDKIKLKETLDLIAVEAGRWIPDKATFENPNPIQDIISGTFFFFDVSLFLLPTRMFFTQRVLLEDLQWQEMLPYTSGYGLNLAESKISLMW